MKFELERVWGEKIEDENLIDKYNIKEITTGSSWHTYEIKIVNINMLIELQKDFGDLILKNKRIKIYDDYIE